MPLPEFTLIEMLESRSTEFTNAGGTGTRVWKCRTDLIGAYMGVMTSVFPYYPQLIPVRVRTEPDTTSDYNSLGLQTGHDITVVTVDYATAFTSEDVPTMNWAISADALECGQGRTYSDGVTPVSAPLTMVLPMIDVTVSLTTFDDIAESTILSLVQKVNAGTWKGFAPGTCLYQGIETSDVWDLAANAWKHRITHRFRVNPTGWQKVWNPDTLAWDTTVPALYGTADFTALGLGA